MLVVWWLRACPKAGATCGAADVVAELDRIGGGPHTRDHDALPLAACAGFLQVVDDPVRDHLAVEQAQDAFDRPDPAQGPPSPGHGLGPGEVPHDGLDHLGGAGVQSVYIEMEGSQERERNQLILRQMEGLGYTAQPVFSGEQRNLEFRKA